MNDITRHEPSSFLCQRCNRPDAEISGLMISHPEGRWVCYEDYAAVTQWRPIETAPMDGTDILCWCVEPEFEGEENPHTEQRVCFFGQMQEDYSCWMSHYGYEQRPTHWMPLPKPPIA